MYVMLFFFFRGGVGVEIVSHLIVQAGLELGAVPLLQPPGYRDYRCQSSSVPRVNGSYFSTKNISF